MIEYSNRSYRTAKRQRSILVVVTIVVILIAFVDVFSGGMVRGAVRFIAANVFSASAAAGERIGAGSFFRSRASIINENNTLRTDMERLQGESTANAALRAENQELRAMEHLISKSGVVAPIVSTLQSSPFGTFLISTDGNAISAGDLVESADGYVIGRISEVRSGVALVTELFAPHAILAVKVSNAGAQAEGQGGGNAQFRVPRALPVLPGDVVTSPEVSGRPVGIVGHVDKDPSNAAAEVSVRIPVNLEALRFVFVEKK